MVQSDMPYKRLIKFRVIACAVFSISLLGCAISPVAIHDNNIYAGLFNVEKARDKNCNYSSIEGVGVKLGLISFGVGYFDNKKLMVVKEKGVVCKSPIADASIVVFDDETNKITIGH